MKYVKSIVVTVVVLATAALIWNSCQIDKANKIKDEANAALTIANDQNTKANEKVTAIDALDFPADREKIKPLAREATDLIGKVTTGYRDASTKFQQAADAVSDDVIKEYFSTKSQAIARLADSKDVYRQILELLLDDALDAPAFNAKLSPLQARQTLLIEQHQALEAKGTKLAQDNKDKIK